MHSRKSWIRFAVSEVNFNQETSYVPGTSTAISHLLKNVFFKALYSLQDLLRFETVILLRISLFRIVVVGGGDEKLMMLLVMLYCSCSKTLENSKDAHQCTVDKQLCLMVHFKFFFIREQRF